MTKIDEELKQYATPRQVEIIDAVNAAGGIRAAARNLKIRHSAIQNALHSLRRAAALRGYSPEHDMTRTVPDPFIVRGVSTYYNKDGKASGQWVKSRVNDQKLLEIIRASCIAAAEDVPRLLPIPAPALTVSDLCNLITLTDCHVGMLAWHKEGGADWDISIAEKTLTRCFEQMVLAAPAAEVCVVNQLGDFLHSDGMLPVTPTSGHVLDQDSRFSKIVQTAVRILRRVIDIALHKHARVVLVMGEGNHDMASSIWLRVLFKALYENEPRVSVIDTELPYYAYQHGNTMLAFHHGHLAKNDSLPLMFAAMHPVMWGATTKRYCHTGHRHHVEERSTPA